MVGTKFSYDCQLETRMATAQKRRDGIASFLHVEHVPKNSWKIWRRAMCDISQCLIFIFLKTSCLAYRNPHIPASVYTVYIYVYIYIKHFLVTKSMKTLFSDFLLEDFAPSSGNTTCLSTLVTVGSYCLPALSPISVPMAEIRRSPLDWMHEKLYT